MPITKRKPVDWKLAFHANPKGAAMAEPGHRLVPKGITSGVSLREGDIPKSSVQTVKDICLHFVRKCSGEYVDNKAAARYVHQMADEVIGQLSGVAAQIKRHEAEPELYQSLLNEWTESFPASLGAYGSPRAIAEKLARNNDEINILRDTLEKEKQRFETEIKDVKKAMDAQLTAYRKGIMSERRQIAVAQEIQLQEKDAQMKELEAETNEALEEANETHQSALRNLKAKYDSKIRDLHVQIQHRDLEQEQMRQAAVAEKEAIQVAYEAEFAALHMKIESLNEKLLTANGAVKSDADVADGDSIVSLELEVVEHDSEEDSVITSDSDTESEDDLSPEHFAQISDPRVLMQMRAEKEKRRIEKQKNRERKAREREIRKREKQLAKMARMDASQSHRGSSLEVLKRPPLKLTGIVAEGVRALKEEVKTLKADRQIRMDEVVVLKASIDQLLGDNRILKSRCEALESLHEELRAALKLQLQASSGSRASSVAGRLVTSEPYPLCHTPHLLGPADMDAPRRPRPRSAGAKRVSGYQRAGRY